jgi:Ca2+-binding EF-hand superfamily protein
LVLFTLGVYDHFDEADQRSKRLNVLGEAQAYGVAESKSERVASDLYLLSQTADRSLIGRSYGIKKNLSDIKESKAYQFPMLGYSVGRFEKHIDNHVPEYLLVKDFLNSISTFMWDSIVKRSYKEVELNLERMPIPEKPEYDVLEPIVKSASNELSAGSDTLKIRYDTEVESSKVSEVRIAPLPKKETLVSMAPVKPAFADGDLDRNGFITASEIERTLEEIMEGRSKVTVAQFNEMVQYYTYFTNNADPIDFGGTEVVIVDGVLTILKKEGEGFGDESRRILAKKYEEVDFNKDGDLTADEVQKMINLFMEGKSSYSAERIYELIDLFFE